MASNGSNDLQRRNGRFSRRSVILWRLLLKSAFIVRRAGLKAVSERCWQSLVQQGGFKLFLIWLREVLAFELRDDSTAYRRWLGSLEANQPMSPHQCACDPVQTIVPTIKSDDGGVWKKKDLAALVSEGESEFVLLSQSDAQVCTSDLLWMVARAKQLGADILYTDEDQLSDAGRHSPKLKPDFSIDLQRSEDYVGSVYLISRRALRNLIQRSGEPDAVVCPFELILRGFEVGLRIEHVPAILIHWEFRRSFEVGERKLKIVNDHLIRCYGNSLGEAIADPGSSAGTRILNSVDVSIIIPTRDRIDLLKSCLESVYRNQEGPVFEIIIVDNGSTQKESLDWLAQAPDIYPNLRVLSANYAFNWSKLNNQAAQLARGDLLLFLNNDVEVISEHWLMELSLHALRRDIGVVGPLLLYPDGSIQHAGIVVGIGGFADHIYAGCPTTAIEHLFVHPFLPRNVCACTGACLMISASKFSMIGGFNEKLAICGDLDLGIRLHKAGLLNRYHPNVRLYHHESATRPRVALADSELTEAKKVMRDVLEEGDPYYSKLLSLELRYPELVRAV